MAGSKPLVLIKMCAHLWPEFECLPVEMFCPVIFPCQPWTKVIKLFLLSHSIIYLFLFKARVFLRIGSKNLPGTNTRACYQNL
jgi:hypothetical protein